MALAIEEKLGLGERERHLLNLLAVRRGVDTTALIRTLVADSLEQADRLEHLTAGPTSEPNSPADDAPPMSGLSWDAAAIQDANWDDEDVHPDLYRMQARTVGVE